MGGVRMRILVVEDEEKLAAVIKRGLEEYAYTVYVAHDGQEGLDRARAIKFDLIILDLMLPKLDGLTLCKELREQGNEVGILMLTAKDALTDRVTGLDAGADDYLVKPFAFRELIARIQAICRRGANQHNVTLEVGDLKLDLVTHQAERDGKTIPLSTKEFALLELLMRHPNQMLSRTIIAEQVWTDHFSNDSNVVDVYISFLRRKIDDDFQVKLIQTVQKLGYRLSIPAKNEQGYA
jgi:DNA-binding response OmpR family regulator